MQLVLNPIRALFIHNPSVSEVTRYVSTATLNPSHSRYYIDIHAVRYWSRIANFNLPHPPVFGAPIRDDKIRIYPRIWHQKTGVLGLLWGVVCAILCLAVLATVCDGRAESHNIHRPSITSRGKNRGCYIDCPPLQNAWTSLHEFLHAATPCLFLAYLLTLYSSHL